MPIAPGSGHNGDIKRAAYGYEPTREAAMAAFVRAGDGERAMLARLGHLGYWLGVGWRWSPWCRACSSSSTASATIAGGLSMSRLSAVLLRDGCSDGPANIFWPANEFSLRSEVPTPRDARI